MYSVIQAASSNQLEKHGKTSIGFVWLLSTAVVGLIGNYIYHIYLSLYVQYTVGFFIYKCTCKTEFSDKNIKKICKLYI